MSGRVISAKVRSDCTHCHFCIVHFIMKHLPNENTIQRIRFPLKSLNPFLEKEQVFLQTFLSKIKAVIVKEIGAVLNKPCSSLQSPCLHPNKVSNFIQVYRVVCEM